MDLLLRTLALSSLALDEHAALVGQHCLVVHHLDIRISRSMVFSSPTPGGFI